MCPEYEALQMHMARQCIRDNAHVYWTLFSDSSLRTLHRQDGLLRLVVSLSWIERLVEVVMYCCSISYQPEALLFHCHGHAMHSRVSRLST